MDKKQVLEIVEDLQKAFHGGMVLLGLLVEEIDGIKVIPEGAVVPLIAKQDGKIRGLVDQVLDLQSRMPSALRSQMGSMDARLDRLEKMVEGLNVEVIDDMKLRLVLVEGTLRDSLGPVVEELKGRLEAVEVLNGVSE